jgi:hypothetical protein
MQNCGINDWMILIYETEVLSIKKKLHNIHSRQYVDS